MTSVTTISATQKIWTSTYTSSMAQTARSVEWRGEYFVLPHKLSPTHIRSTVQPGLVICGQTFVICGPNIWFLPDLNHWIGAISFRIVRTYNGAGVEPIRALRGALKFLLRRFGLKCGSVSVQQRAKNEPPR
jgi:hypothetical protein